MLSDDLFVRGAGGMVPTPWGAALSSVADALQTIEAALVGGPVEPALMRKTSFMAGPSLTRRTVPGALRRCSSCRSTPACRADLLWRSRLAVTVTTILFAPDGLKQRRVYDGDLVCLLRDDRPAAEAFDADAYLASGHLIAPLGGAPEGYLNAWLREHGLSRTIRHSFGSAHSLVRETGLVATLPRQARCGLA